MFGRIPYRLPLCLFQFMMSIYFIKEDLNWSWPTLTSQVYNDSKSTIFNWDWQHNRNFFKQFFSGAFIAVVMTGLDQDMMQKNLTCRNLKESQKNIYWMSLSLIPVNLLFMVLGVLLYQFVELKGIVVPPGTDNLFPYFSHRTFFLNCWHCLSPRYYCSGLLQCRFGTHCIDHFFLYRFSEFQA